MERRFALCLVAVMHGALVVGQTGPDTVQAHVEAARTAAWHDHRAVRPAVHAARAAASGASRAGRAAAINAGPLGVARRAREGARQPSPRNVRGPVSCERRED